MVGDISISDTARIEGIIHSLGLLITIGKYFPVIVGAFAILNLILAYFDLFVWSHIAPGILNALLSLGGFIFLIQLLWRQKKNGHDYRYTVRNIRMTQKQDEEMHEEKMLAASSV